MKKMICLLLSVMLLLVGCGQEKVPETSAPPVTTEAPVTTVPETAPTTQATEPPQTYQAVVKAAMQTDETTGNGDGVGLLEDLDGDGVEELLLVYTADALEGGGSEYKVYSLYTMKGTQLVTLAEQEPVFSLAGGNNGFAGLVELDGTTYFGVYEECPEAGTNGYFSKGSWRLYTLTDDTLELAQYIAFDLAYITQENGEVASVEGYAILGDGIVGAEEYLQWTETVTVLTAVSSIEFDSNLNYAGIPLAELYDQIG